MPPFRCVRLLVATTVLGSLAMATGCQPSAEDPTTTVSRDTTDVHEVLMPTAPWESFVVHFDSTLDRVPGTMRVLAPDGSVVDLEPVQVEPSQTGASSLEFVPREELEPGRYVVVEAVGVELDPQPETQVLPWGTDFELPEPGEALLLDVESAVLVNPPGVGSLIGSLLDGDVMVEFLEPSDDTDHLPFRVVLARDDGACVVHESAALATTHGTLLDVHPVLDYDAGPATGQIYGVQLELAFWQDRVRTRTVSAVADTAALGPWISGQDDPYGLCDLLGGFGVRCGPCPVAGTDTCVDVEVRSMEGERVPLPWEPGAAIATCNGPGQPLGLDIEPIECGCDGSGGLGALWLGLLALALVRRS